VLAVQHFVVDFVIEHNYKDLLYVEKAVLYRNDIGGIERVERNVALTNVRRERKAREVQEAIPGLARLAGVKEP
jgi:hypothetical protein